MVLLDTNAAIVKQIINLCLGILLTSAMDRVIAYAIAPIVHAV